MRRPASLLAMVLLVSSILACGKTVNERMDDGTITTRVKVVLLTEVLRPERIDVTTFKGVVTLSGRISSKQQEEKAIALARTVRGVKDVKSTLQITQN